MYSTQSHVYIMLVVTEHVEQHAHRLHVGGEHDTCTCYCYCVVVYCVTVCCLKAGAVPVGEIHVSEGLPGMTVGVCGRGYVYEVWLGWLPISEHI